MQGFHVPRKAGWDCHGLPVELAVEKELGFSGKQDIEAYGIAEFNATLPRVGRCGTSTRSTEMTERMGYWVDMDDAYRTMDPAYVESVWWSLKQIFDKGLLVEDHRVAPYCPRCGTGLSDHELAQGYETVVDPSVYVRFPLTSGPLRRPGVACWSGRPRRGRWCPTPRSRSTRTSTYVVAHRRRRARWSSPSRCSSEALGEGWTVAGQRSPARELERWTYQRPFDLVDDPATRTIVVLRRLRDHRGRHRPGAPVARVRRRRPRRLPRVRPAGGQPGRAATARSRPTCRWSAGCSSRTPTRPWSPTSSARGLLFRHVPYEHSYPHCWRCHTALLYYAQPSWYIRTTAVKDALLARERADQLVPRHDQARPLRRLAAQQRRLGAVAQPLLGHAAADLALRGRPPDLRRLAGRARRAGRRRPVRPGPAPAVRRRRHLRLPELRRRRPRRVPEVIDAWYDSGSMPFAQWGYPHAERRSCSSGATRRSSSARRSTRPAAGSTR